MNAEGGKKKSPKLLDFDRRPRHNGGMTDYDRLNAEIMLSNAIADELEGALILLFAADSYDEGE